MVKGEENKGKEDGKEEEMLENDGSSISGYWVDGDYCGTEEPSADDL